MSEENKISKEDQVSAKNSFCQEPSDKFLKMIEEAGGDPRSAMGLEAIRALKKGKNVRQPADAREPGSLTPLK